jgi:omega-6 fatty acid desaturase (delta-12 desaturase)
MSGAAQTEANGRTALDWSRRLAVYKTPKSVRASIELIITIVPFVLCWYGLYWSQAHDHWLLYAALMFPTVGFLVRMFLIQHDCGHQAFFPNRRLNDWLGRAIGVLTLTPYYHWRRAHAIHHATSGNLSRRGVGDIDTLTVDEYRARTPWQRWRYRLYRSPAVMFAIGPLFVFVLQNRIPAGFLRGGWRPWISTLGTNLALAVLIGALVATIGLRALLIVHLPIVFSCAAIGGWLFYVQHQFAQTSWDESSRWSVREAALQGSSHYALPPVLRWFSANIGVHHVHHLCSLIPFYRLPKVIADFPELAGTSRITLRQSLACVRLTLWDSDTRRLVSFRDAMPVAAPARVSTEF